MNAAERAVLRAALAALEDATSRITELLAGEDYVTALDIEQRLIGPNHSKGRPGAAPPIAIVDHISEGTLGSMESWFRNPRSKVSAHYGVGIDGRIWQFVLDQDTAWHAGLRVRPTAPLVLERPDQNPNGYTIGIEHEGFADDDTPEAQIQASAELHAYLAETHGLALGSRTVIRHRDIRADKSCPGRLPVEEIIRRAVGILTA